MIILIATALACFILVVYFAVVILLAVYCLGGDNVLGDE